MKPWELPALLAYIEYIECADYRAPGPQQIMDAYADVRKLWDSVPDATVNSL